MDIPVLAILRSTLRMTRGRDSTAEDKNASRRILNQVQDDGNGHTCIGDGYRDLRDWAPPTFGTLYAQNDERGRDSIAWVKTLRRG
jgi:hypothetical protein